MTSPANIRYLTNTRIDKELWDQCISNSTNGLIYGYSYYLDYMANQWDALVLNGYEAVMPLPWRKKWGIYYLYQPFVMAQLGVFGNSIDANLLQRFLETIPNKFKYLDLPLNYANLFSTNFPLHERMNYVLDLNTDYETIYKNYRENIRRNIKRAKNYSCIIKTGIDAKHIINLAKQTQKLSQNDLDNFLKLCNYLLKKDQATTYGVYSSQKELLASCIFFFSHNRAYYILVGNHPNGKTLGASHALIDAFIKDHAGKNLLLDFEGSDIRNLAFFYSSFGAKEEKYAAIRCNRLPWYLKWLKK